MAATGLKNIHSWVTLFTVEKQMHGKYNAQEREWVGRVKELPCSVCDAPPPSDAHHIEQHENYTVVALCRECHQGSFMGWHGQKRAWKIRKMNELNALNITIGRVFAALRQR